MSQEARQERKKNFSLPTAEELRELQTLEKEREFRVAQRHQREQSLVHVELQQAGLITSLVAQLPRDVDENKSLVAKGRDFLHVWLDKANESVNRVPEPDEDAALEQDSSDNGLAVA